MLQITSLHKEFDKLQNIYGEASLKSVYGAGKISHPKVCLVFMNPTARNLSCLPDREGMRAPRVGFKQTRKMIYEIGFLSDDIFTKTQGTSTQRTPSFVNELFTHLAENGVYITNLAKCTQSDAKPLPNSTFKAYLPSIYTELQLLQPKHIITFGNQVSSILLGRNIQVSSYENDMCEVLNIENTSFKIYPCRYPVGMGYRNIDKAKHRIQSII